MNDTGDDKHASNQNRWSRTGNEVGEAAGGLSGVVVGAAIGSLGGPVGTIIGGIAGAIGGWWAGDAVAEVAQEYSLGDDAVYRNHYENSPTRLSDRHYESVSSAYKIGHLAARNPDYRGLSFEGVEDDLNRGWNAAATPAHGRWETVREYVKDGYDRSSSSIELQRLREKANDAAEEDAKRLDDAGGINFF